MLNKLPFNSHNSPNPNYNLPKKQPSPTTLTLKKYSPTSNPHTLHKQSK
ncbi:50S ribosomal protein L33 [Staphylococcus epidermidis]